MKQKNKMDREVLRALTLITQFGINMLVPLGLMLGLGIWLDRKLGTSWITIVLFFVGAIAGGQNIYRMTKSLIGQNREDIPAGKQKEEIK